LLKKGGGKKKTNRAERGKGEIRKREGKPRQDTSPGIVIGFHLVREDEDIEGKGKKAVP